MLRRFMLSGNRLFATAAQPSVSSRTVESEDVLPPPRVDFIAKTEWDSPTLRPALSRLAEEYRSKYLRASSQEEAAVVLNEIVQWSSKIREVGLGQLPLLGVISQLRAAEYEVIPLIEKYFNVEEFRLIRNSRYFVNKLVNIYLSEIVKRGKSYYKNDDEELEALFRALTLARSTKCSYVAKVPLYLYIGQKDTSFVNKFLSHEDVPNFITKDIVSSLIKANELKKAFEIIKTLGKGGHWRPNNLAMELLKAATVGNDGALLREVSTYVTETQSAVTLYGYLGTVLLELNNDKGLALYQAVNKPNSVLLAFLVNRVEMLKRPDIIHKMFTSFNRATTSVVDLEMLVRRAVKLYAEMEQYDAIREIGNEVRQSSLPIPNDLRSLLDSYKTTEKASENG